MGWRFFPVRELKPRTNEQFQSLAAELNAMGAVLYGEGSPQGRYEAQLGALYQQRDPDLVGTDGILWVKTTPAGNTGWQQLV